MRSRNKKIRKLKPPLLNVARTMGKWKPQDDYLLIETIIHLENINDVFRLVKFSSKFSQKELEDRWYAILYDAPISKMVYKNIKKLHSDDILRLKQLIPFNDTENSIILNLESTINQNDDYFENLLIDNRIYFYESRTFESLRKQFNIFKKLNLLKDQVLNEHKDLNEKSDEHDSHESDNEDQPLDDESSNQRKEIETLNKAKQNKKTSLIVDFNQIENSLDDAKIVDNIEINDKTEEEMANTYNSLVNHIKRAEADLFLWQSLIDKLTGSSSNPFIEPDTLAVIFNENLTYSMKKREIIVGRSREVDVDLSKIDPFNKKISRNQFRITMLDSNYFFLFNIGKLPVYVDGRILLKNDKTQIYDKSIVEIGDNSMLFLVNYNNFSKINLNLKQLLDSSE